MPQGHAVFLDTSIQIARVIHNDEIKGQVKTRVSQYDLTVSSEVVKQEFKRRLLKEAQYLLNQLNRLNSFQKVQRHVIDNLPPQQNRKRNICLQTLQTIYEHSTDSDLTERAKSYLRSLLRFGLDDFEDNVKHVERTAGCACSKFPVIERTPYKTYDFGKENCSKAGGTCGIVTFLAEREVLTNRILGQLRSLSESQKSEELKRAQDFLERFVQDPTSAPQGDPCLKVGDLIIALESASIPDFYTLNAKESQHLCRALDQNLIVRPKYHIHPDVVCAAVQSDWTTLLASRRARGTEFQED